ncbi:hypothetical protein IFM89_017688 [Coptis chinensis]|uniref:Uncharacterized protein n=1 Tax=Coptis chinensis TaxID=261450 RepID=A0A835LVC6_9MAGN|nr:hypothetical protein IFM89_017688 [Coptis chinensis]
MELVWKGRQPVGPRKYPILFSKSLGVLMAISKRNRANRVKQIAKHAIGRIGFSQFEEIMEAGAPPSIGDLFVRTHTSSQTHDALDDQSREYINKMKDLAGIDEHGTQLALSDEIYREVMPPERHGTCEVEGTSMCNPNQLLWLPIIFRHSCE